MRSVFIFLVFCASIIGCSSSDNSDEVWKDKLVLTVENTVVEVGNRVLFTVKDDKGEVVSAAIYVEGELVGNPVLFDKEGVFTVVAKRQGYKASNVVKVTVGKKSAEQLILRSSDRLLHIGEKNTFSVWVNDEPVPGALVYNLESGIPMRNMEFVPQKIGNYTFVARRDGYSESEIVHLKVMEVYNKMMINGRILDNNRVYLDVDRELIKNEKGEDIEVDKIWELSDGRFANHYALEVITDDGNLIVMLLVVNEDIVRVNGKLLNRDKRKVPNSEAEILFNGLAFIDKEVAIFEPVGNELKFDILFKEMNLVNNGIGFGASGKRGNMFLEFEFKSKENEVLFEDRGMFWFSEILQIQNYLEADGKSDRNVQRMRMRRSDKR